MGSQLYKQICSKCLLCVEQWFLFSGVSGGIISNIAFISVIAVTFTPESFPEQN